MKSSRFFLTTLTAFTALFCTLAFLSTQNAHAANANPWWQEFEDAQLTQLIEKAQEQNPNLRVARLKAALDESTAWVQFSPLLPTVSIGLSSNVAPANALGFGLPFSFPSFSSPVPVALDKQFSNIGADRPPDVFITGNAQLQAAWRIDAGASYFKYAASLKDAQASQADRDEAALRLSQQVAQSYFDLLAAVQQQKIFAAQLIAQEKLLKVVELRFSEGSTTSVDVLQQRQQVAALKAQQYPAHSQVESLKRQLKGVLALAPDEKLELELNQELPAFVQNTQVELDVVLTDRPDLRAARSRVTAAQKRSTSAFLAFFPSLTLSAQAGPRAQYFKDFQQISSWGLGASLSIPLFSGQILANYNASLAGVSLAKENVRALEISAATEVSVAQIQKQQLQQQLAATLKQAQAAEKAVQAARQRYLAGLLPYQNVVLAENAFLISSLSSLEQNRRLISAHLSLLDAAAGSFTENLGQTAQ